MSIVFQQENASRWPFALCLHTLLYLVFLLSLSKVRDMMGRSSADMAGIAILGLSFAHLAFETMSKYPANGAALMLCYFVALLLVSFMIEAVAIRFPEAHWMAELLFMFYGALLLSRTSFEMGRQEGSDC